ncbi:hypothetical protein BDV59DRAFT_183421 [Aspergillus ambiguus]|uniref:bZIP transcription factor n=1 Tax=Aspergillus ambiguus TaxID=176160 RepID=UPI003CCCC93A
MSDLLAARPTGVPFAYADPKDTLLSDPMVITNALCDELLRNSQAVTNTVDSIPPAVVPPGDQLPNINKPFSADTQSSIFSYDGPPSAQYDMVPSPTAEHHVSPSSLQLSPQSDGHIEGRTKSMSPSSEGKKTGASQSARKPGRRPSRVGDDQREKFLEKNRIAANKHRKRKKEFIQGLESRYGEQLSRKDQLKAEVSALRAQALDLQETLFTHAQCNNQPIQNYLNNKIGCIYARQPVSDGNGLNTSYRL